MENLLRSPRCFTFCNRARNCRLRALALGLIFVSAIAHAEPDTIIIIGIGSGDCAEFLSDIATKPQTQGEYFSWAQGYMSGLLARAPPGEIVDLNPPVLPWEKQAKFLHMYCYYNTRARFVLGVETLYKISRQHQISAGHLCAMERAV